MANKSPGILSLVLIPALISLAVCVLRLVGELNGWNPTFFGNAAPGAEEAPGIVGISWLILPFGAWFGLRLRALHGEPAHLGKTALRFFIAFVVMAGGMFALDALDLIAMPDPKEPAEARGFGYMLALLGAAAAIALFAWPRLAITLCVYALLARLPVVAITWFALGQEEWDTHYTKLPAGTLLPEGVSKFSFLALPQVTFWVAITMVVGGLCGCLGAALKRRSS